MAWFYCKQAKLNSQHYTFIHKLFIESILITICGHRSINKFTWASSDPSPRSTPVPAGSLSAWGAEEPAAGQVVGHAEGRQPGQL